MNKLFLSFLMGSLLFFTLSLNAQNGWKGYEHLTTPVQSYLVYKIDKALLIDGLASEPNWEKVTWSDDFADIEGHNKPKPLYRTRVKMLYDATNLYILAELEEPHIWASYDTHDMIIYHENDFEVFIDPDGDTHNYFEYEVNAKNTLLDLKMSRPYRDGGKADIKWDSKGFRSAVSLEGTLNDPSDIDRKWTIETKIPFADLGIQKMPMDGQIWKINFSRVEWQTQVVQGKYEKVKNPSTGRAFPENNWVWSPPGLINMHYPERWGIIQFSKAEPGSKAVDLKIPLEETVGRYIWLIYYKQQDFKRKNGHYANSFEELDILPPALNDITKVNLQATTNQFTVHMKLKDGTMLTLNETGLFHKNQK